MELDEMRQAWRSLDQRVDRLNALQWQAIRDRKIDRAHRHLRPLWWGQMIQIGAGVVLMLLFAPYWVVHLQTPHLAVYGLMLHAYGLSWVVTAARNLYLQGKLDYGAPVLEIQHRIAELRTWRIHEAVLHGVVGCFMWIPLLLIVFQQLGADVWISAPAVVWAFIAAGGACLGLMYGLIRWSRMPGHERVRAALENSSIGRSVLGTQALVAELAQFEQNNT